MLEKDIYIHIEDNYSNELTEKELIYLVSDIYNVDANLMYAIMKHETGNFTSHNYKVNNNICGMFSNGSIVKYDNKRASIIACIRNIKFNYINEGLTTIKAIGGKYAPVGAKNDPNNVNQYWVPKVTQFYNEIK